MTFKNIEKLSKEHLFSIVLFWISIIGIILFTLLIVVYPEVIENKFMLFIYFIPAVTFFYKSHISDRFYGSLYSYMMKNKIIR